MNHIEIIITVGLFVTFSIACVFLLGLGIYYLNKSKIVKEWPYVVGEILISEVIKGLDSEGFTNFSRKIKYNYSVNGKLYTSERINIAFSYSVSNFDMISNGIEKYKPGNKVNVYYNPLNPQYSIIEQNIKNQILIILGIGILIAVGLLISTFVLWYQL